MNKKAIFFAVTAAVLTMSSCKQNTEPRFQEPTEFELNTPALATQYFDLETPDATLSLDWSQPDWGFSAVGLYHVQMSLSPDFQAHEADGQHYEAMYQFKETFSKCSADLKCADVATGLCALRGIKTDADYTDMPAGPVYFRVVAELNGVAGSEITSNVICYSQLKGYCAVPSPGRFYLVGAPEGWKGPDAVNAEHYADWTLYEDVDAIGSDVYHGTFQIPAGQAMFRFYAALTGWDADSYGSQAEDNPLDFEFVNNEFSGKIVKGKGAYNFTNWTEDGTMAITLNMKDMQLIIKASH